MIDGLVHLEVGDQHGRIALACGKSSYSWDAASDRESPRGVFNPVDGLGNELERYSARRRHVTCDDCLAARGAR